MNERLKTRLTGPARGPNSSGKVPLWVFLAIGIAFAVSGTIDIFFDAPWLEVVNLVLVVAVIWAMWRDRVKA